jgi:hypothetical protein
MKNSAYPTDFSAWSIDLVRTAFGLKRVDNLTHLNDWMSKTVEPLSEWDNVTLKNALSGIGIRARYWSESDIKMKLIGPALIASKFDNEEFSTFAEVTIRTELVTTKGETIKVSGRPDIVIAMGEHEARLPFFCMQEYKRQLRAKGDPQGQMLIELLAARQKNIEAGSELPILYGAFTIGREWIFAVLEGNKYALSKTYLLDVEADLIDVTLRLRALKYIIADMIGATV